MTERLLSRVQVRQVDRIAIEEFGIPGVVLMENAGRSCAELLLNAEARGPVCLCCGKGNNAGDGFVMARHLANRGIDVDVLLFAEPASLSGDAAINYRILDRTRAAAAEQSSVGEQHLRLQVLSLPADRDVLARCLDEADWIVDALLGTGAEGAPREPYATVIEAINAAGRPVMAVDLPSGLDCDTGQSPGPCVRARLTATFVAQKPGFSEPAVRPFLGDVCVIDIGVPPQVLARIGPP